MKSLCEGVAFLFDPQSQGQWQVNAAGSTKYSIDSFRQMFYSLKHQTPCQTMGCIAKPPGES